jgi:hypothetical protein
MSPEYATAFDVMETGYRALWFPSAVLILAVLITMVGLAIGNARGMPRRKVRMTIVPIVVIGLLGALLVSWNALSDYRRLRKALTSGHYKVVEGVVTQFVPGDDHRWESFVVDGRKYSYSWSTVSVAYNRTKRHGGTIQNGVRVRIADVGGEIARLEIAR